MSHSNTIKIISYDESWNQIFDREATLIREALGAHANEIYHIGSTAIPNMSAKPIIDILIVCNDLHQIDFIAEKLKPLGYGLLRRQMIPHCSYFTNKKADSIGFNLHLHERGSPQINRHVNFRNYVSQHPDVAREYVELKQQLARKFAHDRYSYVTGKDKLVQAIDAKAKLWEGRKRDYLKANTGQPTNQWTTIQLVNAMKANLNVHMTHFAQYLNQVELIRVPGFTIVNSGLQDDTFNYVLDADFAAADANNKIHEITQYFKQNSTPFSWWVGPGETIETELLHNGYINTENSVAMYFDLDAWVDNNSLPQLEIRQAKDEKTLRDFALVVTNVEAAFEEYFSWIAKILTDEDPIEYYVGYVDNKPVVRGLSCYFGQVVGLHWLSTVPEQRKKGYGAAMQRFRLNRAKQLGYHVAVLQASTDGYPLYKKLGYKECGSFREFKNICGGAPKRA